MSREPKKYNEFHEALKREVYQRMEINQRCKAAAQQTILLATHSLENYAEGSPWRVVEEGILEAAQNVLTTETANIAIFEKVIEDLDALDT